MDAVELARIVATLETAIAEARVIATAALIDEPFRELVRHAHEMHNLLVEALLENEPLASPYLRGIADSTGNAIDELEVLIARADVLIAPTKQIGRSCAGRVVSAVNSRGLWRRAKTLLLRRSIRLQASAREHLSPA